MAQPSQGCHCHCCHRPAPRATPGPDGRGHGASWGTWDILGAHGTSWDAPELARGSWWSSEPKDSEGVGIVGLGGHWRNGNRISCPTAQTVGEILIPTPSPLPAMSTSSLQPGASSGVNAVYLITGAKENSSVGKRSKGTAVLGRASRGSQAPVPAVPGCPAARPRAGHHAPSPFQNTSAAVCCSHVPDGKEGIFQSPWPVCSCR